MPDETKDRIVDAAYGTLVKRGYEESAMKDIAAEAGVAPGLAHYYFETKEDLLVAAIEHGCGPLIRAWEAAGVSLSGPMPEDADAMLFARMGFELAKEELKSYGGLFLLTFDMFGVGLHNPKIPTAVRSFIEERRALVPRLPPAAIARPAQPPRPPARARAAAP